MGAEALEGPGQVGLDGNADRPARGDEAEEDAGSVRALGAAREEDVPFHRQADRFMRLGLRLDRGTMCRWAEELGATLGATVVEAIRDEVMRTAFCISTDAAGVLVQPIAGGDQARRGFRRGHFLVQIADADHIFFEYLAKETSAAIGELFRGFSGYVQANATSVYDLLFKPPDERQPPDDGEPDLAERRRSGAGRTQGASCGRRRIFDLDRTWRGKPPGEIRSLRDLHLPPTPTPFLPGSPSNTSGSKASAACCARRWAMPIASADRSPASSTMAAWR